MGTANSSLACAFILAYTLKYPNRVDRLVLISPAGIPLNPLDPSPSPSESSKEQTDAAAQKTSLAPAVDAAAQELRGREETKQTPIQSSKVKASEAEEGKKAAVSRPRLRSAFGWAWEQGFSPFGVLRALPFLAPKLVGAYASRRFEGLGPDEVRDMQ